MGDWLSGMSGNLVADLLAVPVLWFAGRAFLNRRVSDAVYARLITLGPRIGAEREVQLELVNGSGEPIHDVWAMREDGQITLYHATKERGEVRSLLLPNEVARSAPMQWSTTSASHLSVHFKTVHGEGYSAWALGSPETEQVLGGWHSMRWAEWRLIRWFQARWWSRPKAT